HHLAVVVVMVHRHAAVFGHVECFVFGGCDPRTQNGAVSDLTIRIAAVRFLLGAAGDEHADAFHVLEDGGRFPVPVGDADDDVVGVDGIVYIAQPALHR